MAENNDPGQIKKARVLVVDDSKLVRVTAARFLAQQFDLVLAEDGEEAWQKICSDNTIQVVFTDLGMPKLDGYGLIQRVRESENEGIRNQPIIVITGAAEDEDVRRRVFELGATDFITKPFKSTEMIARAEAHSSYRRDKDQLQKNVSIDLLTGALNPSGVAEQLQRDISFVNRHAENLAVVMLELDDFQPLCQRIGQAAADRIIKQVAECLLGAVRKEDSVGRYGFAKFILLLPMAKTEGVVILAKRLCARIKAFTITVGGQAYTLTLSAGIAAARKGQQVLAENLLETAENALANARGMGPGEVQLLKVEDSHAEESQVLESVDALLQAIKEEQIEISAQQMASTLKQLAPLISLMSEQQKQQLLNLSEEQSLPKLGEKK